MSNLRIGVVGAAGRMGAALIKELKKSEGATLTAASEQSSHPQLGQDAGLVAGVGQIGVNIIDSAEVFFSSVDCVIEFSSPDSTVSHANYAAETKVMHVVGTTGLSEAQEKVLELAAQNTQIFWAPNMSMGLNVLLELVELM